MFSFIDRNDVDYNDDVKEIEVEDAALSRQVADCLKHTNKQKLAYALRAMKRLDLTGDGYITVREFRDVLLMYQIFIIGGTLEKLIEKYKSNGGKINYIRLWRFVTSEYDALCCTAIAMNEVTVMESASVRKISNFHYA